MTIFESLDKNGDGSLVEEEFIKVRCYKISFCLFLMYANMQIYKYASFAVCEKFFVNYQVFRFVSISRTPCVSQNVSHV